MKNQLLYFFVVLFIVSCGPSAQEKAAIENEVIQKMKAKEDSVAAAKNAADAVKNAQKQHDDSIANSVAKVYQSKENSERTQNEVNSLLKLLIECDGQLAVLKDRQKQDGEFHIGRTTQERENTLKNDQLRIDNLKMRMININAQIQKLRSTIK